MNYDSILLIHEVGHKLGLLFLNIVLFYDEVTDIKLLEILLKKQSSSNYKTAGEVEGSNRLRYQIFEIVF